MVGPYLIWFKWNNLWSQTLWLTSWIEAFDPVFLNSDQAVRNPDTHCITLPYSTYILDTQAMNFIFPAMGVGFSWHSTQWSNCMLSIFRKKESVFISFFAHLFISCSRRWLQWALEAGAGTARRSSAKCPSSKIPKRWNNGSLQWQSVTMSRSVRVALINVPHKQIQRIYM